MHTNSRERNDVRNYGEILRDEQVMRHHIRNFYSLLTKLFKLMTLGVALLTELFNLMTLGVALSI